MNVKLVTEAHCGAGIAAYEQFGHLLPKFWAQSDARRAVAEPMSNEAMGLTVPMGVVMLGFMCDIIGDARFVGRTMEAWSRPLKEGDMIPADGLQAIADQDPTISTAIIAQGLDMWTDFTWTAMASFSLTDQAEVEWKRQGEADLGESFALVMQAVQMFVIADRPKHAPEVMHEFIAECGWAVRVFD